VGKYGSEISSPNFGKISEGMAGPADAGDAEVPFLNGGITD